ncbi:32947_t:CDS:2, partial [Racocetra persica]
MVVFERVQKPPERSTNTPYDGSHKNNHKGSYAGIGVCYENGSKQITEPLPGDLQTNNRAELYAVIRALET